MYNFLLHPVLSWGSYYVKHYQYLSVNIHPWLYTAGRFNYIIYIKIWLHTIVARDPYFCLSFPGVNMCRDQEEWVGCRRYWFWAIGKNSVQIILFYFVALSNPS